MSGSFFRKFQSKQSLSENGEQVVDLSRKIPNPKSAGQLAKIT